MEINPGLDFSSGVRKATAVLAAPCSWSTTTSRAHQEWGCVTLRILGWRGGVKFNLSFYFGYNLPSAQLLLCNSCTELFLEEEISRAVGSKSA